MRIIEPSLILGCHGFTAQQFRSAIKQAWSIGYRHFDVAAAYVLREADGKTETTSAKILGNCLDACPNGKDAAVIHAKIHLLNDKDDASVRIKDALGCMLSDLGRDYVDELKIHGPYGRSGEELPWRQALGAAWAEKQAGRTKAVGICNVNTEQVREALALASQAGERLDVIEIESNPYCPNKELSQLAAENGVHVVAYRVLCADKTPSGQEHITNNPVVMELAKEKGCDTALIPIAQQHHFGHSVIYRSSQPERLKAVYESAVDLSDTELQALDTLEDAGFQSCKFWSKG
ncbi:MAG: aldo/keto reductase [Chlamydiia bacterium]|nr:aldo/keto reductase [Chlamydiia bacterium]